MKLRLEPNTFGHRIPCFMRASTIETLTPRAGGGQKFAASQADTASLTFSYC
jgi:hypothetical protein